MTNILEAAEKSLATALEQLDHCAIAYKGGHAAAVAAAAYAVAVARGDVVPGPNIATATSEHHSHGLFG